MTNSRGTRKSQRLIIIGVGLLILASLPLFSSARSTTRMATSLSIVNNSTRDIRNVYLSHVDADDWSANQLGSATISGGQSFNLNVSPCDGQQMKVIGEDQDGCFVSTVVNCGDNATWTLTNDTARDCGY